jgi:hypothetical protein
VIKIKKQRRCFEGYNDFITGLVHTSSKIGEGVPGCRARGQDFHGNAEIFFRSMKKGLRCESQRYFVTLIIDCLIDKDFEFTAYVRNM